MKTIEPIKVALLAVGGDGGSVFTNWCVALANQCGYYVSSTSIAGVAQRTGATIYYMEFLPQIHIKRNNKLPVLSQMPTNGDLDIVIATEVLEIARAYNRGFINKKTTVLFSSHRSLAMSEKESAGDDIFNVDETIKKIENASKVCIYADFKNIANKHSSIISSSLFGALAGSNALGFSKSNFEKTIVDGGVGVNNSLKSFEDGYILSLNFKKGEIDSNLKKPTFKSIPNNSPIRQINNAIARIKLMPQSIHDVTFAGFKRVSLWQNYKWGNQYLDMLEEFISIDEKKKDFQLSFNIAKYLSIAMSYYDVIYAADIKTSKNRFIEVKKQVSAKDDDLIRILDYLHPGFDEICGMLPKSLGAKADKSSFLKKIFKKYFDKDRRMNTINLFNFIFMYLLGGLKWWRFKTYRHHIEMNLITKWLDTIKAFTNNNYDKAVLITKLYQLQKGYGDTYSRSHSKFLLLLDFISDKKNENIGIKTLTNALDFALKHPNVDDVKTFLKNLKLPLIF